MMRAMPPSWRNNSGESRRYFTAGSGCRREMPKAKCRMSNRNQGRILNISPRVFSGLFGVWSLAFGISIGLPICKRYEHGKRPHARPCPAIALRQVVLPETDGLVRIEPRARGERAARERLVEKRFEF